MTSPSRYLHTMLRVGDLDRAVKFYEDMFGMKEIRRWDAPAGKFTNAFVGFGPEETDTILEFTYNYGVEKYDIGTAYGHIAIGVPDVYATCERLRAAGARITREPGPVKHGTTIIAFLEDPDGYKIELVQRD
jgi:lactoylglutathione lyase